MSAVEVLPIQFGSIEHIEKMKATLIEQETLRLIVAKSARFPEGNRQAFQSLESPLTTLRGRRFYGLCYSTSDGMEYYAGLVPENEEEVRRFADLGCSVMELAGGPCRRIKLDDWQSNVDQIGPVFGAMIREYGIDHSRPQMEFYRSLKELHLLLPVPA